MQSVALLDSAGRRRSPATLPTFHQGRPPRNKGLSYPPDPPTVEEIITVMRAAGNGPDGLRLRALIVVLWRAGLRISEALALTESDLDCDRGAILVRRGKGGKRREVGMDRWGWEQLSPWLTYRATLPVGALFCILRGATRGRPCSPAGFRRQLCDTAQRAGVRRRFAPHQLRHAHAVEMSHTNDSSDHGDQAQNLNHDANPCRATARESRSTAHQAPPVVALVLGAISSSVDPPDLPLIFAHDQRLQHRQANAGVSLRRFPRPREPRPSSSRTRLARLPPVGRARVMDIRNPYQ